jgi:catechol 2,3-dioxygenase-like lactoylglutathione lyase family enzyme
VIARLTHIVIDCPHPVDLAPFYESLLGATRVEDSPDWIMLAVAGLSPAVALQRSNHFIAPDWSSGDPPQQLHLDLLVDDLDRAERDVLALGARLLEGSDKPIGYRVYADPVGHPFCLVTPEGLAPASTS